MDDQKMRLYVWKDPYSVRWGSSIVYAVATSEEEARKLATRAPVSHFGGSPDPSEGREMELGVPRVVDLPYAEIYEWSE